MPVSSTGYPKKSSQQPDRRQGGRFNSADSRRYSSADRNKDNSRRVVEQHDRRDEDKYRRRKEDSTIRRVKEVKPTKDETKSRYVEGKKISPAKSKLSLFFQSCGIFFRDLLLLFFFLP